MSRVLKDYDWSESRRMKYPWNDWLDGRVWEIERGEDFVVDAEQMRKNIYNAAWTRGLAVRTGRKKNKIVLQAFGSSKGNRRESA